MGEGVEKLKPCPFCGEAEELYPAHYGMGGGKPYAIDCLGCGFDFVPREHIDVITAWNRRAALASSTPESALDPRALGWGADVETIMGLLDHAAEGGYSVDRTKAICATARQVISRLSTALAVAAPTEARSEQVDGGEA
jgi:Lar family restriction alleviation protein